MSTFEQIRSHPIVSLQATVEEYLAPASGARHIHLLTTQPELAFLVAFPTVPDSSDGRAHILEHLALCGSQRYPVRDPFFSMMRRSTATFMNAMTYADRTVYPFASTDRNDFFNLLDVYLDATFFPRLDYLNFLQEGWRHTLKDGVLGYQGVVFNEMKGAFNDPMRALYGGIVGALLAGTTYEVVSGGDPLAIPDLTHQMLKDFHASHYHPSQAVFMSAGALPAAEIQRQISERVLSRLSGSAARLVPQLAAASRQPRGNTLRIPSQSARPDEFGLQLTWLMGEASDPAVYYNSSLLSAGLLGDASAPLRRAMESAGYGRPSRLNGHDPGARQMLFHVGMEGLTSEQVDAARTRIREALEATAQEGVPHTTLQAALRDLRYRQCDTSSGQMPNILDRMLRATPVALRGGDVMDAFDSEAQLRQLERDIADPAWFKALVRQLLESNARLTTRVEPDAAYFSSRDAVEQARLAATLAGLSAADKARIEAESDALDALQGQPSDAAVLPRIKPGDVSPAPHPVLPMPPMQHGAYAFPIASNGISYARVLYDLSALPAQDWPWLRLYADLRADLGVAGYTFEEAGAWRQRMVPVFGVALVASEAPTGLAIELAFTVSGLREEHANMAEVLEKTIGQPRFDEHERIAFLIARMAQNKIKNLAQAGNQYASLAATAPLSPLRQFEDAISGVPSLPFFARLQQLVKSPEGVREVAAHLTAMHAAVTARAPAVLCAGAGLDADELARMLTLPAPGDATQTAHEAAQPGSLALANAAYFATGQVNHCSIAWRAPGKDHPDSAPMAVAAELMTNQLLHQALREKGGAYGGSASYARNIGLFSMMSYRDPRMAATYADFSAAVDQLLEREFSTEQLEEAIICVIKRLDKPDSPFDSVLHTWRLHRNGVTEAERQQFRSAVLHCTLDQVRQAVRTWLKNATPSRAAFVGNSETELAGMALVDLLAAAGAADAADTADTANT